MKPATDKDKMTPTIFITGASSGIGRATAWFFHKRGWNVVVTMREPDKPQDLPVGPGILRIRLDVTDKDSIRDAAAAAVTKFGRVDVLVNNAGFALVGIFEAMTAEHIERQFRTNLFGLMEVTRAFLPHFRHQRSGVIINVSSVGAFMTFPLYSPYHATKWAVEGFSESLQFELAPFNIRVKLIEPGPIKSAFYDRSEDFVAPDGLSDYQPYTEVMRRALKRAAQKGGQPTDVAKVIYRAASDRRSKMRYLVGGQAKVVWLIHRILPTNWFMTVIERILPNT